MNKQKIALVLALLMLPVALALSTTPSTTPPTTDTTVKASTVPQSTSSIVAPRAGPDFKSMTRIVTLKNTKNLLNRKNFKQIMQQITTCRINCVNNDRTCERGCYKKDQRFSASTCPRDCKGASNSCFNKCADSVL